MIGDHDIEGPGGRAYFDQRLLAVASSRDFAVFPAQEQSQELSNSRIVLYSQNIQSIYLLRED